MGNETQMDRYFVAGFQFDQLDGCIDKTQIGIKLDDPDARTLKYRLSEFKDKLTKEFNRKSSNMSTGYQKSPHFSGD